jgi:hypothetical protein
VDRLGGGASHDLDVAVVEVDGQGGVGDGHADGSVLMQATEGDFLAGDHDDAGVGGPPLHTDRLDRRLRWWPGRADAPQLSDSG